MRIPFISLIAAGSLALGGCAYGDLGYGVGLGYGGGYGGYYGDYGYGYGSPYYGYGYGSPYYGAGLGYGWYDNYYYPGTGYYVYDTYRRPHRWSDRQRDYWSSHRQSTNQAANWSRFMTYRMRSQAPRTTSSSTSDTTVYTDSNGRRHRRHCPSVLRRTPSDQHDRHEGHHRFTVLIGHDRLRAEGPHFRLAA